MPVQRPHHRGMRHHRVAIVLPDQHQYLDGGLPFPRLLFSLGQFGDVVRGVAERDQLAPAGQNDRIEKSFDAKTSRYSRGQQKRAEPYQKSHKNSFPSGEVQVSCQRQCRSRHTEGTISSHMVGTDHFVASL
jgi:hypothetical protein